MAFALLSSDVREIRGQVVQSSFFAAISKKMNFDHLIPEFTKQDRTLTRAG
jgi:hypothetical protein